MKENKNVETTLQNKNVENELIDSKEIRSKYASRVDVLDKVEGIMYLPFTEFMTSKMVADFYKVSEETIKKLTEKNSLELKENGFSSYSKFDIIGAIRESIEISNGFRKGNELPILNYKGKFGIKHDGDEFIISNRGLKLYNKRCVLLVGMLLRDSEVAKVLRFQILNSQEMLTEEQNSRLIQNVQIEKELSSEVANSNSQVEIKMLMETIANLQNQQFEQTKIYTDQITQLSNIIKDMKLEIDHLKSLSESENVVEDFEEVYEGYLGFKLNTVKRTQINAFVKLVSKENNISVREGYLQLREMVKMKSSELGEDKTIDITNRIKSERKNKNYSVKSMYDVLNPSEFEFVYKIAKNGAEKIQ